MSLAKSLVSVLACPQCHSPVRLSGDQEGLLCGKCQLLYPVRDGIPVMIVDQAVAAGKVAVETMAQSHTAETVMFEVVEGPNKGLEIKMPRGSCRAIGRSLEDMESTRVFDEHAVIGLDDSTKKLVLGYITKQFHAGNAKSPESEADLGSFQRLPDIVIADKSISRLHAMLFHSLQGVGVLDLVSKNGTFVNGIEVESKLLQPGDVLTVGDTKLRLGKS